MSIRIATRQSQLALWQAEHVARRLTQAGVRAPVTLVKLTTQGDRILDAPLAKIGGKGLFTKELEQALLEGRADLAVHSMKDVTVTLPAGLHIGAILEREDPRDAFVAPAYAGLEALPAGACVGTSSLRRQSQLRARYPALDVRTLRGNVNTRLKKLDAGEFDAVILAAAGLKRLGLGARIRAHLGPELMLSAVGQGAIGIECRRDDARVNALIAPLHHADTGVCVTAERALNARLEGGCQVPIGAYATRDGTRLHLRAFVGSPDGARLLFAQADGDADAPEALGIAVAEHLLAQGAGEILKGVYGA